MRDKNKGFIYPVKCPDKESREKLRRLIRYRSSGAGLNIYEYLIKKITKRSDIDKSL